jgi:hypothetical protein
MHVIMKLFFFFFLTCPHKRGGEIRTSDLHFIRRGPQPIELPLGDCYYETFGIIHSYLFCYLFCKPVMLTFRLHIILVGCQPKYH